MAHLLRFDDDVALELLRDVMAVYHRMVQRHLYYHGSDKCYLSKSLAFSVKLRSIRETFPDAKVVCRVRTPSQKNSRTIRLACECGILRFSLPSRAQLGNLQE